MRSVWKYTFPRPVGEPLVVKAITPVVVHVGIDDKTDSVVPSVWIEVDTDFVEDDDAFTEMRFVFVGTGHPLPDTQFGRRHVGSCATRDHTFVWHVYEVDVP